MPKKPTNSKKRRQTKPVKKRRKKATELVEMPKAKGAHPFLICYPLGDV